MEHTTLSGNNKNIATNAHSPQSSKGFYGRRHGKTLRPYQHNLLANRLPQLKIDPSGKFPGFASLFPENPNTRFHMEIGFGGGEHLNAERLRQTDVNFLGVEPFVNGLAKFLGAFDCEPSSNIKIYNDDAIHVLDWLPDGCVWQLDLLYPDPWPKKKHWKRRFVNPANIRRIARVLRPGGIFRFVSDIDSYVNWTLHMMHHAPEFYWIAHTSSDWLDAWPYWVRTRYETKAIREGRRPGYFIFERHHDEQSI